MPRRCVATTRTARHPSGMSTAAKNLGTTRRLGNSDMNLTAIGFGAWAIGGGNWQYAWGAQDDNESVEAILRALDAGVNWIDTAAVYGLGHSEEVVGRALKQTSEKPYVFTKCAMIWGKDRKIAQIVEEDSPGVRGEPETAWRGCDRPLPDSLAGLPMKRSKKAGAQWPTCSVRAKCAGSACRTSAWPRWSARTESLPITSLQPPYSMINRGDRETTIAALVQRTRYRRDQLLADDEWAADRRDDEGTRRRNARR